jgi:hypothetical protein
MAHEEMVYGVCHETELISFQNAILGPQSKEGIEAIQSENCFLEKTSCWLPPGSKSFSINWFFERNVS